MTTFLSADNCDLELRRRGSSHRGMKEGRIYFVLSGTFRRDSGDDRLQIAGCRAKESPNHQTLFGPHLSVQESLRRWESTVESASCNLIVEGSKRSFTIDRSFNSIIFAGSWVKEKSQFWPHLANLMNSLQTKSEVHRLSSAQIAQLKTYPLKDGNDAVGDSHHKRSVEIIECI